MAKIYHLDGNDFTYVIDTKDESLCQINLQKFKDSCGNQPGVIFTSKGVALLNVLQQMQDLDYEIGKDLGICGFDDWGWASLISPGITTITQHFYETGTKCAELLIRRIKQGIPSKARYVEMPAELVVRGSTIPR